MSEQMEVEDFYSSCKLGVKHYNKLQEEAVDRYRVKVARWSKDSQIKEIVRRKA